MKHRRASENTNQIRMRIRTTEKRTKLGNGTVYNLEPGTVTYIPPGEPHKIENTGNESLDFLFVYSPGGPEAGIRKWKTVHDEA